MSLGVTGVTTTPATALVIASGDDGADSTSQNGASTASSPSSSTTATSSDTSSDTYESGSSDAGVYTADGTLAKSQGLSPDVVPSGDPSTWTEAQILRTRCMTSQLVMRVRSQLGRRRR